MAPNRKPKLVTTSHGGLMLTLAPYPSSSQNRSPKLTATSPFFRTHSPCTLDLIRSTSFASTNSPRLDGTDIDDQKRRKTLTSLFCTALWQSSFRPFTETGFHSEMLSIFYFTSHSPFQNARGRSSSPKASNILSNTSGSSRDQHLIPWTSPQES